MVRGSKVLRLVLDGEGSHLGMEKGCFIIRDKHGNVRRIPLFENEIGEIEVSSGNFISTGVLACCGFWNIPVIVKTRNGNPVAVLRSLDDNSHVKTRIAQYEALKSGKGIEIAKTIVYSKIESQNIVLSKYGLKLLDLTYFKARIESLESKSLKDIRKSLLGIEGRASKHYYGEIFKLLPESLKVEKRRGWRAYDGINNTFNLAYTLLKFRVHSAVLNAHLEPYLGFVHSEQWGKPSLVCDLMELYRYIIDDYIIQFSQKLTKKRLQIKNRKALNMQNRKKTSIKQTKNKGAK